MKTNKFLILILILAVAIGGCKKKIDPVSKIVDVTYPTIVLNGPSLIYIHVGGSYADEGATLTDDVTGDVTQITATSSELDPSSPGLYAMKYEAANSNGFRTEVDRIVLVLDYTPAVGLDPNLNLGGDWLRSNGAPLTYTRVDNGLYVIDKIGGSTAVPVYLITPTNTTIDIPLQTTIGGLQADCLNETIDMSGGDTTITYNVDASGFGTQLRTFTKVH